MKKNQKKRERTVYLIANAHIDPIWQWELDEGMAAALSTFRSAADLAEEYDFIFCHNEAMLYEYIEENDPALFARIAALIKSGKWRVIGGWYLQPDCTIVSGESFVRQITTGREYFYEKFGVRPEVAVNFDPFGHSWGLVQILKKTGYKGYLICRPGPHEFSLPSEEFIWKGNDGSEIITMRSAPLYCTPMGMAVKKIRDYQSFFPERDKLLVLWGVGNHGGGPSRADLDAIQKLSQEADYAVKHSYPEEYMGLFTDLPEVSGTLGPCMPGCYISQSQIKGKHRLLENILYFTEKLVSAAKLNGIDIPSAEEQFAEAQKDLMLSEFHDVLPGTSIKDGENDALDILGHGLTICKRLRMRAMMLMTNGFSATKPGEYTFLVFNPHPYPLKTVVECEFMLADQNHSDTFKYLRLRGESGEIPSQIVKERSMLPLDWRKRVAFTAVLPPFSMSKFDGEELTLPSKPVVSGPIDAYVFENEVLRVKIGSSGFIGEVSYKGKKVIDSEIRPVVFSDDFDPWGLPPKRLERLGDLLGAFSLMSAEEATVFSGGDKPISPLRIIEDGPILMAIEACCKYGDSSVLLTYRFYKELDYFDISLMFHQFTKDRLFKLEVPAFDGDFIGEIPFGYERLKKGGGENGILRWAGCFSDRKSVAVLNGGTYSASFENEKLYFGMMRTAAYTSHPIEDRDVLPGDRFINRIDQGERQFSFRFVFGTDKELIKDATVAAQGFNEKPYALYTSAPGGGKPQREGLCLSNPQITVSAFRPDGDGFILRLHNNSECGADTKISVCGISKNIDFRPFEVKTFRLGTELEECAEIIK